MQNLHYPKYDPKIQTIILYRKYETSYFPQNLGGFFNGTKRKFYRPILPKSSTFEL